MEAQIIKYVTRWESKGGAQDLDKALHFLQKLREVAPQRLAKRRSSKPDVDAPRYE